jgi:hypothetical protein
MSLDNDFPDAPARVPARLKLTAAVSFVLAAVYVLCCLIYNAPASPATIRLAPIIDRVMNPYFEQAWTLFAPTPPSENEQLLVQAVIKGPNGADALTAEMDTAQPAYDLARSERLWPSKLPGVVLAFQEEFAIYSDSYVQIEGKLKAGARRANALRQLRQGYRLPFAELDRYLSAEATSYFPGRDILFVRGYLVEVPVVPFSERYQRPPPRQPHKVTLDTGWMTFISGVAQ